jgi:leucyl/phenylalanyl-tRNA--protein transferase
VTEGLNSSFFPPPQGADESGLLCVGGELTPTWLIDAYRHGIFPWPVFPDPDLIAWWSPDPRAILEFGQFHVSRRLARTIGSGKFRTTRDQAFEDVIHACATTGRRAGETWITPAIEAAYVKLYQVGYAHSVEAWIEDALVGGVYGVTLGGLFAAESMFHVIRDASKVALAALVDHLAKNGFGLLDIQQLTPHTARLGAAEIPRDEYLRRLDGAIRSDVRF